MGRRIRPGVIPAIVLGVIAAACALTLPYAAGGGYAGAERYAAGSSGFARTAPAWAPAGVDELTARQRDRALSAKVRGEIAARHGIRDSELEESADPAVRAELAAAWPRFALGSDHLGRSLLLRILVGGAISLVVGVGASAIAVVIGVGYGAVAGYAGGRTDAVMMRVVDILYGLPSVLLIVLLAVAADAAADNYINRNTARRAWIVSEVVSRTGLAKEEALAAMDADRGMLISLESEAAGLFPPRELPISRTALDLGLLFAAIGGVSWLTMARVIRGQVMSLKARPFVDAARAVGASPGRIFFKHLLPNLHAPIIVYATLMVPQAILQESFLSFLGMGVRPPLPSWGSLAADALPELNPYRSNWWLLVFPCLMLAVTLLSLNFLGEAMRARMDPKGRER